jgi:hypothetical protein
MGFRSNPRFIILVVAAAVLLLLLSLSHTAAAQVSLFIFDFFKSISSSFQFKMLINA